MVPSETMDSIMALAEFIKRFQQNFEMQNCVKRPWVIVDRYGNVVQNPVSALKKLISLCNSYEVGNIQKQTYSLIREDYVKTLVDHSRFEVHADIPPENLDTFKLLYDSFFELVETNPIHFGKKLVSISVIKRPVKDHRYKWSLIGIDKNDVKMLEIVRVAMYLHLKSKGIDTQPFVFKAEGSKVSLVSSIEFLDLGQLLPTIQAHISPYEQKSCALPLKPRKSREWGLFVKCLCASNDLSYLYIASFNPIQYFSASKHEIDFLVISTC